MGTSCKKIHIRKKIRKKIHKKIQEDTFNDPVSTPYGKANSSLRPDSFLKSLVILKFLPCQNMYSNPLFHTMLSRTRPAGDTRFGALPIVFRYQSRQVDIPKIPN